MTVAKANLSPAVQSSFDPGSTDRTRTGAAPITIPTASAVSYTSKSGRVKISMMGTIGVNTETGGIGIVRSDTGAFTYILNTNAGKMQHAGFWIFNAPVNTAVNWTPSFASQSGSSTVSLYAYNPARMIIEDIF